MISQFDIRPVKDQDEADANVGFGHLFMVLYFFLRVNVSC